ncbi:MAG: amidase [Dehalococcoidia bacterium]|nr:amidase [Dehalococcoidia bacterium]
MNDLQYLTISEAAGLIKRKAVSPAQLAEALISHIEANNPRLDAFITRTFELARAQACKAGAEIAAGRYRGPLHGIPFGLKDIYSTRGILTSGHSRTAMDNVPQEDATTVTRLYEAGAVLMGKLATHEFAHGGPSFDLPWPPARNPWNRDHFTGGSSSGSGAAVAAGFVLGALGSDTGGSIRGPASLCGVAGLKPTYGLVSRHGVMPNSYTFDHCGPMTWTVADCASILQTIAGYDSKDPASVSATIPDYSAALAQDVRGLRVGVVRHFWEEDLPVNDEMRQAMEAAVETFRTLGAVCEDVRLAPLQDYYDVKIVIAESELFSVHRQNLCERPGDFGADFLARSLPACLFSAADYVIAQRRRRLLVDAMAPVYDRFDVLLTASAAGPAPRLDAHRAAAFWEKPNLTTPFNVTGGPALTLCCGFSAGGLPLGMQIAGRPFEEATVLRLGHAFEKATPWRDRRPKLESGPPPAGETPAHAVSATSLDTKTRSLIETQAMRAGLRLNEEQIALASIGTPHALAMAGRLRSQTLGWGDEPASVFRFS